MCEYVFALGGVSFGSVAYFFCSKVKREVCHTRNIGKGPGELMPDGGPNNSPPSYRVIPAKAGIQDYQKVTGFRLGAPRRLE